MKGNLLNSIKVWLFMLKTTVMAVTKNTDAQNKPIFVYQNLEVSVKILTVVTWRVGCWRQKRGYCISYHIIYIESG